MSRAKAAPGTMTAATAGSSDSIRNHAAFIWSVADLLRGDYKQSDDGKVILPLTVLRRFDCVLAPTREAVLARYGQLSGKVANIEPGGHGRDRHSRRDSGVVRSNATRQLESAHEISSS